MIRVGAVLLVLAIACRPAPGAAPSFDWPARVEWAPAFVGVEQTSVTLTAPRPLRRHAVRVDLSAEGGGVLGLLRNSGAGVFNSEAILDVGLQNLLDVESADLDANGFPDLVVAASGAAR